jgi:hypothetical protein
MKDAKAEFPDLVLLDNESPLKAIYTESTRHGNQASTFDSKLPEPLQKRPKLLGKSVEQSDSVEDPPTSQPTVAQTLAVPQLNRNKRKVRIVDSQAETESESFDTDLDGEGIGSYPLTSQE